VSALEQRFGRVIREQRAERGWSQERLAEAADLNRSYLGEIERGEVTPSLTTAEKLAAAFRTSLSALVSQAEQRAAVESATGGDSL
jgi:XRE family transcriptional regulator, regulator of sulfur utilization